MRRPGPHSSRRSAHNETRKFDSRVVIGHLHLLMD